MNGLQIRPLTLGDVDALADLVTVDPPDYRCFFEPFPGGQTDIKAALEQARRDAYWGFFLDGGLCALVMLRGLDAGFAAPAFGVYVAQQHTGQGLATVGLALAESWCRLNSLGEVMLTVHPDHARARHLYETEGFDQSGELSAIGHLVYRKRLR